MLFTKFSSSVATVKVLAVASVTLALTACGTLDSALGAVGLQRIPASATSVQTAPVATPAAPATTWVGSYAGSLPCPAANCEALEIRLSLHRDATFRLETKQVGAATQQFTRQGAFMFNADETRITLDANGQGRVFELLNNGRLRMMGPDGKPVTGSNAARFILRRI